MSTPSNTSNTMRTLHRYLGFFLAGIFLVYSLSGIVLIFRDTDFLKNEKHITKTVEKNATTESLGKMLNLRQLKVKSQDDATITFENGTYNKTTGVAEYTVKELPFVMEKMTHLHKAKSADPLYFLNIFFGISLLFFVLSAFWMYMPGTSIFKKGLYYTLAGIILTLVLLFV
jgi:hypothetical protein